jgi:hypothetical protein
MGESQAPFALALGALARLRQVRQAGEIDSAGEAEGALEAGAAGNAEARDRLASSLDALRELDDKAHLAYVLNEAAALALEDRRCGPAAAWAAEALTAARAVRRPTEAAVAAALLVRAAAQRRGHDLRELEEARRAVADWPQVLRVSGVASARACAAMALAGRALTTLVPTAGP